MNVQIYTVSGYAGHGKDTVCHEGLDIDPDACRVALADALKVKAHRKFEFDYLKVNFDPQGRLSYPEVTTEEAKHRRTIHQRLGTEIYREMDPDYWLKEWSRRAMAWLNRRGYKIIWVPDVRFPNEADFFQHELDAVMVYVDRGEYRRSGVDYTHESEMYNPQLKERADIVLNNTRDLEHLYLQVRSNFSV